MASEPVARTQSFSAFIAEFERLIPEVMEEWKVSGLAVAVVQDGEVAFINPYGLRNVEAGLKVTTDTQFQLMSVSKSFTATGLAVFGARAAHGLEEVGGGFESREQYMPFVELCLSHVLADSNICMCVFDFRQAQGVGDVLCLAPHAAMSVGLSRY